MKLTPTEILKHLGFSIPEEGVEINANDAFLMTSALQLAGQSIDFDRISDGEISALHRGLSGIVSAWSKGGLIVPIEVNHESTADSLAKLRSTLAVVLKVHFNRQAN